MSNEIGTPFAGGFRTPATCTFVLGAGLRRLPVPLSDPTYSTTLFFEHIPFVEP